MELSCANAHKRVGEPTSFSLTRAYPAQSYAGRTLAFASPIAVAGTLVFDGKAFWLEAEVSLALSSVCARCARSFLEPVAFSMRERFVRDAAEDADNETYPYSGDVISIEKAVFDNLYLHLPIASVCREDCKGLCPVCGCDRNETACACQVNEANAE